MSVQSGEDRSFIDYVDIFQRRALVIVVAVVVVVGLSAGYVAVSKRQYTATASIELLSQNVSSYNGILELTQQDVATDISLVQSPAMQVLASKLLGTVAPLPTVSEVGQTTILNISVTDGSAKIAAAAANAYANAYVQFTTARYAAQYAKQQAVLLASRTSLTAQIQSLETQIGSVKSTSPLAQSLDSQLASLASQLVTVNSSLTQLNLAQSQVRSGATVSGVATTPTAPSSPHKVLDISVGVLLGLMVGAAAALTLEYFDDRIKQRDDLVKVLGTTPIIGEIPVFMDWKGRNKSEIVAASLPKSVAAEAYRSLRTAVQYITSDEDRTSIIQLTSAQQGEGKSTTVIDLAVTMAMSNVRVVIVDCDMRRPTMQNFFETSNQVGLSTILEGQSALDDATITSSQFENLSCVPSGPIPTNPSELLASSRMATTLEDLRGRFDVVILDSPALLPVTDSVLLSQMSDVVLMVARMNETGAKAFESAIEKLQNVKAPLRGAIINCTDLTSGRFGRYNNYVYYQN
jgi:capsular exopolysaccharide synthesis family protein